MLDENRTCIDKVRYHFKGEAKAAVRSGIKDGYMPITSSIYVCIFCGYYHKTSSRTLVPRRSADFVQKQ